jgi:hypothetical protein
MDHALELDRQLTKRGRGADRERLIEGARQLHVRPFKIPVWRLEESKAHAKFTHF